MVSWRKLIVFAALLPCLAAAADPAMLELIMPDARFVMYMNMARMVASPIGQTMSNQMKSEMQGLRPDAQQVMMGLNGVDWARFAQEAIFASDGQGGKDAPALVIVRGLLDPAWIESLHAFSGQKSAYLGVPVVAGGNSGTMVAFLDGSIAVIGKTSEVKAAIRRRGQNTPVSPVLAEGLERYDGQYDAWVVSAGPLSTAVKSIAPDGMKWPDRLDAVRGGVRLTPDFELSADFTMRSEKDVAEMSDTLRWFAGVVQTQARGAGSLDNMNFRAEGKHLSFSVQVPEQQVRAALQQRQGGPVAQYRPPAVHQEILSGLPDPPSGSIRVQSSPSDMGTVLVPLGKTQ